MVPNVNMNTRTNVRLNIYTHHPLTHTFPLPSHLNLSICQRKALACLMCKQWGLNGLAQIRQSVALNKWRLEVAQTPIDAENVNSSLTGWIWVRTGAEKQAFMLGNQLPA
jgi:hypothetical protein